MSIGAAGTRTRFGAGVIDIYEDRAGGRGVVDVVNRFCVFRGRDPGNHRHRRRRGISIRANLLPPPQKNRFSPHITSHVVYALKRQTRFIIIDDTWRCAYINV